MRWWEEAFNDTIWRLSQVEVLKRAEGMQLAITELKSLMHGKHLANNSSGNLRISGSLNGRIPKTLIYGKRANR